MVVMEAAGPHEVAWLKTSAYGLTKREREVVLGLTGDIFRVSHTTVRDLAIAADRPEADVVFLSCTNLRTFGALAEMEEELKKPVLSANQVTVWAPLRAAGLAGNWHRPPPVPAW